MIQRCNVNKMSLITFIVVLTIFYMPLIDCTKATPVVDNNIKTVIERRIYHGDETDISDVPFSVFIKIQSKSRSDGIKICGGVIIDNVTVLTAAHCLQNSIGVQIIAGSSNPLSDKNVQRRVPNEIIVHPEYKYDTNKNTTVFDFALIRLRTRLTFDRNVQAAVLPMDYVDVRIDVTEVLGKVCGWGGTDEAASMSPTLLCTSAHILTNSYCDVLQQKIELSSDMICTGRSSCQGDSGSGLMDHNGVVIGIVSFTLGPCHYAVPPVVHGKITSSVLDFIRNNTESSSSVATIDIPKDDRIYFPESF